MTETDDDTVETSLTDELLAHTEAETETASEPTASETAWSSEDDEEFLAPSAKRSRWTTGLVVALIFVLGAFCGVLLGKALSPTPAPQVVYLLGDGSAPSGSPSALPGTR